MNKKKIKKRTLIIIIIIQVALILSIGGGFYFWGIKNNIDFNRNKTVELNPELKDMFAFSIMEVGDENDYEYADDEDDDMPDLGDAAAEDNDDDGGDEGIEQYLVANLSNGAKIEILNLSSDDDNYEQAFTYIDNKIYLYLPADSAVGFIDLTKGDGKYSFEKLVDIDDLAALGRIGLAVIGDSLYYIEGNAIKRFDLTEKQVKEDFRKYGNNELIGLYAYDEKSILILESSKVKNSPETDIKLVDVTTKEEKLIAEKATFSFIYGNSIVYNKKNSNKKNTIDHYIYQKGQSSAIVNGVEAEGIIGLPAAIAPADGGYIYGNNKEIGYFDGTTSSVLYDFGKKGKKIFYILKLTPHDYRIVNEVCNKAGACYYEFTDFDFLTKETYEASDFNLFSYQLFLK